MSGPGWTCALELRSDRSVAGGSKAGLIAAMARGADLRVYTEFLFEEHIVPGGDGDPRNDGLIREVIDFRETMVVEGRHGAGLTTLRQALHPPFGFNGSPRMSFFLYTVNGEQACANVMLAGSAADPSARPGTRAIEPTPADMPKMSPDEVFDIGTLGPSRNFVYDMEVYRYFVRDDWQEVLAHDADGHVTGGSFDALEEAQIAGREIKVGVRGLAADVGPGLGDGVAADVASGPEHEVFTSVGSGFLHTGPRLYDALTHPLVRVAPAVPLRYTSFGWDVAWVFLRTDGEAVVRRLDPYTQSWSDRDARFGCRWFAR